MTDNEWLDDAADYSSGGTDCVFVQIESRDKSGQTVHMTDFKISPEQARAMFLGLANQEGR